jgi:hypothetical protein
MTDSIKMIAPNGASYNVPADGLSKAQGFGWKTEEQVAQEAKDVQLNKEANSGVSQGVKNFGNEFGLGVPKIIEHALNSEHENEVSERKEKNYSEEHPIANFASKAAGFAGSLAIPGVGEIGKAAEGAILGTKTAVRAGEEVAAHAGVDALEHAAAKPISDIAEHAAGEAVQQDAQASLGRQLAAKLAKNAAMAEAYNAPSQVANLAVGDPEQAKESLFASIGLGSVLGLGEFGLGKAASYLAPEVDKAVLDRVGVTKNATAQEKQSILDLLKKENKFGNTADEKFSKNVIDDATSKIKEKQDMLDNIDHDNNPPSLSDNQKSVQEVRDNTAPDFATNHYQVNPAEVANSYSKVVDGPNLLANPLTPEANAAHNKILDTFAQYGGTPTSFDNANSLKEALGNLPDSATVKVNGKQIDLKDFAQQHLQDHIDSQTIKGLGALPDSSHLSEFNVQNERIKAAQLLQNPSIVSPPSNTLSKDIKDSVGGVVGGAIGGVFGHPAIGAAIGSGGNVGAAKRVLGAIAGKTVIPMALKTLNKLADTAPEAVGPALAKAANDAIDKHMATIPQILESGAKNIAARSTLGSFLGSTRGLSEEQQYKKATTSILKAAANPETFAPGLGELTSMFGADPHLQSLVAQHNTTALNYLASIVPKDPNPPQAFGGKPYEPSAKEKNDFLTQLAIVDNPMVAVHKAATGTLTAREVTTLQTVYPVLAQKITTQMTAYAYSPAGKTASNATKIAIAKAGGPKVPSLEQQALSSNQGIYSQPTPQQAPNGSPPAPTHTNHSNFKSAGDSARTSTQRLSK